MFQHCALSSYALTCALLMHFLLARRAEVKRASHPLLHMKLPLSLRSPRALGLHLTSWPQPRQGRLLDRLKYARLCFPVALRTRTCLRHVHTAVCVLCIDYPLIMPTWIYACACFTMYPGWNPRREGMGWDGTRT